MIVTRSWLEEFINLNEVSNDKLYEVFNAIGLEVDSIEQITIPDGVVVGKILSCEKHPDADKLSVCQIDIGDSTKQIVCGAANVLEAEYVAVATIGTVLGEDFHIKPAELRGVKSEGMVCSSTELGLPKLNDGIMILDDSIGKLEAGKALGGYPKVAETIIELELTANRGDCLSIHGVARDLSAVLNKDIQSVTLNGREPSKIAIARRFSVLNNSNLPVNLHFKLAKNESFKNTLLINLRLAFVGIEPSGTISNLLQYSTHATGVILRAYDVKKLQSQEQSTVLHIKQTESNLAALEKDGKSLSIVGVSQSEEFLCSDESEEILFEASYMEPELLIEGVSSIKVDTDELYYKTSRGSEPALEMGMLYLENQCSETCVSCFGDSPLIVDSSRHDQIIGINFTEIDDIIGQKISKSEINSILSRLGFGINHHKGAESFGVVVPHHRHDIKHAQDIAEEVLRIVGINNIEAKALQLTEKVRLTDSATRYKHKRDIRLRAVGRGFFEAVTYAFCDKKKLEKFGFETVDESLDLINPIAEEFDALRSTLLVNLLDSIKRNINYGIKRIPLFEIGTVFDKSRGESEKIAFVWSGQQENEFVGNQGKPKTIDFATFSVHLSAIIGNVELIQCESKNGLMHPYQSARIVKNDKTIGYLSKLHPGVAEVYGIPDTFIAEIDFEPLLPAHINASPISNYQGVYKDLSVVVDKETHFSAIENTIKQIDEKILKRFYPVDIYTDAALKGQKSVTIRFFIQSLKETMSDAVIDNLMQRILQELEQKCGAKLR